MVQVLLLLFAWHSEAGLLVASPDLPEPVFKEILAEKKDSITPVESSRLEMKAGKVRQEIFELSDSCLLEKKCEGLKDNFASIRERFLLNQIELSLLAELWRKSNRPANCFWKSLGHANNYECILKKINIQKLGLKEDQSYAVFVDGRTFMNGEDIRLVSNQKYHWKIVSARHLAKQAWATPEEVEFQVSLNQPFVTGGCLASNHSPEIGSDIQYMSVAFDRTCIKPLNTGIVDNLPKETWLTKNKKWLVPALVLFGGAYYMRDKQLEIQSPF
jgi:hypothetical protein